MRQENTNLNNILAAMAIGAGCMYFLDPVSGKRRRARIRDKAVRLSHAVGDGTGVIARDLTNRTWGVASSLAGILRHPETDDAILEPRVRSEMGRWVSHPHAIHVEARDGCIFLSGDILASEERDFLRHVARVTGVKQVENHLKAHEHAEDLPILQGGARRESRFELLQSNWAPGPRLLAAVCGTVMVARGVRRRGIVGLAESISGTVLLVRAITNVELTKLGEGAKEIREWIQPSSEQKITHRETGEPPEYRIH